MRRTALIALVAVALSAVLVLTVIGANKQRTLAFTLGVPAGSPVAVLRPGDTICQEPIAVASAFDTVELQPGTFERPGPPLSLDIRRMSGGSPLAHGRLGAGYADVQRQRIPVGSVAADDDISVCITNEGSRRAALYGAADAAARTSTALLNGKPTGADIDLIFRAESRSTLALVPSMMRRMSLFHGGWLGPWSYWLLLVAVLVGAPVLLGRALVSALPRNAHDEPPNDR